MLAKITLYDGTVYKIASATTDTQDGIYLGRIKDELQLVSQMQEAGNAPTTVNLTIINHDNFIPRTKDLWAAELLLTNDNNESWRGKINFCNFDADGNLYVTASEKTAPELELQLPDEVRQVYTVDEDFHQSSVTMTIPLVIGGTTSNPITLPTILIDKTRGIYLICVGEIRSVVKVYNGAKELPQTAYTAYTGTASQEENAGFAYVQIAEDYRLNSDGSYAEINVDVVGLKLGNHTEAECRNGARFLYYFLTTAATGVNGWGCGIDSNLIDITSFNSAITLCDQLGYKLDGIMWLRQSAQSWIDQICQAIHGKYSINANGKRSLFIDYAGNASKKTFTASNMRVDKYGKNSYTSVVYNKGILSYDYNPITGLFMQSAQYENADSIAQIGEQKFVGESYLIKDATTALAVLEYTCKRSQTAAESIEFETDDIETALKAGDVITINRPDLSINNVLYQIQNISTTDFQAQITAVKFDTSVFIVTGSASTVAWGSEKSITPALTPAMATSLNLSTGFDINPDGTGIPYISGTFTVPEGGWLAAAVQYGIGADPTNWTELSLITEGSFKIAPVNVGTVYAIRVRMITATGHSDYLKNVITSTGDTTPPAAPTIAVKATDKTVTVQCGLDNPPYDMGGFQVYRKKSTEQVYTYIGSIAANRGYASFSDYVDEYVTYNYQAKSYDRSGNLSTNFSNTASVTVTGIQANDVAATALAMPTGSILRLSAKNCTTASIAEANGVKDVSGNGNHGQAFGGVTVLDGGEGFSWNNNTSPQYISIPNSYDFSNGFTFFVVFKIENATKYPSFIETRPQTNDSNVLLCLAKNSFPNRINLSLKDGNGNTIRLQSTDNIIVQNQKYSIAVTYEANAKKSEIYINGEKDAEQTFSVTPKFTNITNILVGKYMGNNDGQIGGNIYSLRIYPRALSASEIKTLYMFPDDVTFGQLTADLIGANVIKASNLVMTEAVIASSAQIDTAAFREIVVGNTGVDINNLFYRFKKSVTNGGSVTRNGISISHFEGGSSSWNSDNTGVTWVRGSGTNGHIRLAYLGLNGDNKRPYNIIFNAYASSNLTMIAEIGNSDSEPLSITTTNQEFNVTVKPTSFCTKNDSFNGFLDFITDVGNAGKTIYISNIRIYDGGVCGKYTTKIDENGIYTGSLTANQITVTGALDPYMDIASYCSSNDITKIDGGKIYANSITANSLNVASINIPAGCLCHITAEGADLSNTRGIPSLIGGYSWSAENSPTKGRWNTGKVGAFFRFGSTARLHSTNIDLTLNTVKSVSFWIYLDNASGWRDVFYNNSSWPVIVDGMTLKYHNGSTAWAISNALSKAWYHVVVNYDSTNNKITTYLNGILHKTTTGITISSTGGFNYIGNYSNGSQPLKGALADIRLFNRNLNDAEVKSLYMIGADNTESGQITADRIATDAIKSRNYAYSSGLFSTAGTFLDLANGQIISKNFSIDSSGNATFKGALSGATGTFGKWTITNDGGIKAAWTGSTTYDILHIQQTISSTKSEEAYLGSVSFQLKGIDGNKVWQASISGGAISAFSVGSNYNGTFDFSSRNSGNSPDYAKVRILGDNTSQYILYVAGKARINTTDYGSDEKTKKDFQDVSTLDKLKKLRVCAWRFDEEKLVEKDNAFIDEENIKIEAENKAIDEENAEIEKENELRKNRKDGEPVELLPLRERKKLREHRIADKNANHPLNIGCMAGEFNKAFGTNNGSEDCLSVTDVVGVCMRAIQELAEISDAQKAEIAELKALLKTQQDEKSEAEPIEPTSKESLQVENTDSEPSFEELLKNDENQQEGQK